MSLIFFICMAGITIIGECVALFFLGRSFSILKKFGRYLMSINDMDTATTLGFIINIEKGTVKCPFVIKPTFHEIIVKKSEETNNETYLIFAAAYLKDFNQAAALSKLSLIPFLLCQLIIGIMHLLF